MYLSVCILSSNDCNTAGLSYPLSVETIKSRPQLAPEQLIRQGLHFSLDLVYPSYTSLNSGLISLSTTSSSDFSSTFSESNSTLNL